MWIVCSRESWKRLYYYLYSFSKLYVFSSHLNLRLHYYNPPCLKNLVSYTNYKFRTFTNCLSNSHYSINYLDFIFWSSNVGYIIAIDYKVCSNPLIIFQTTINFQNLINVYMTTANSQANTRKCEVNYCKHK